MPPTPADTSPSVHATRFLELLLENLPSVPTFVRARVARGYTKGSKSRRNRNVDFIESDLEHYLKGANSDSADSPALLVNRKNGNTGKIDYQFVMGSTGKGTLATCELKGPARKKFLENPENNWFWGITEDIAKQIYRARTDSLAHAEHYVAVLMYESQCEAAEPFEQNCLRPLRVIFPTTRFTVFSDEIAVDGKPLSIFLLGVQKTSLN